MKTNNLKRFAGAALLSLLSLSAGAQLPRNPRSQLPQNFQQTKLREYNQLQIQEVPFPDYYSTAVTKFYHEDAIKLDNNLRYRPIIPITKPTMCGNGDFEAGLNQNEWQGGFGFIDGAGVIDYPNFGLGISSGAITDPNAHQTLVSTSPDPNVPISTTAPTGSTQAVRIGNQINGMGAELLSKTFIVPSNNSIVSFWYALVFEDPGHQPFEQPAFRVNVLDASGNPISGLVDLGNGSDIAISNSADPFFLRMPNGPYGTALAYRDWSCASINLSKLIGQQVTIQFVTNDCTQSGHFGYAYIDDFCGSCATNSYNVSLASTDCGDKSQVCLKYQLPVQGSQVGTVDIDLNIYQNGNLITTLNSGTLTGGADYCFGFAPSLIPGLDPNLGGFDYTVVGHFAIGSVSLSPFYLFSPPDGAVSGQNNDCVWQQTSCCKGRNLIINGDFESGNTGIASDYSYETTIAPNSVWVGEYGVLDDDEAHTVASTWNPDCRSYGHHLIVNGATGQASSRVAWAQRIRVTPGATYKFCGAFKLLSPCAFEDKRGITLNISGGLSFSDVYSRSIRPTTGTCNWVLVERTFTVPAGVTSITMSITLNETTSGDGNDMAMDNFNLVQMGSVPTSQTLFGLNPYNMTSNTYNVSANASVALPGGCDHYWEVAEVDPNAGFAVIGSTQVIDPAAWHTLATNTFNGYVGTSSLSGSAPGVFDVQKTYRFVYGRSCTCESLSKRFLIYGPLGSKSAPGRNTPQILGSGVLTEQSEKSATGIGGMTQQVFTVFPNPTDSKVTIQKSATDADYEVKVFNAFGQLVRTAVLKAADTKTELSLTELAPGSYMLHVVAPKGNIIHSEKVTKL